MEERTHNQFQGGEVINGGLGRKYYIVETIRYQSRRQPTPTITYTRLRQGRPSVQSTVMEAKPVPIALLSFFPSMRRRAMVKTCAVDYAQLLTEVRALERLQRRWRLWAPRIVPRLYQGVTYYRDKRYDRQGWFFSAEWLEMGNSQDKKEWEYLSEILRKEKQLSTEDILLLQRTLDRALAWMHRRRVVHGDIKDSHIVVRIREGEGTSPKYDFSDIRFLDFGSSYIIGEGILTWHGATPGFCPPYFWHEKHHQVLEPHKLRWLDRYAVDALLYFALTGEYFPVASPPYRVLLDRDRERVAQYLESLERALKKRINQTIDPKRDWPRWALANWLVKRLCVLEPGGIHEPFYRKKMFALMKLPGWMFLGSVLGGSPLIWYLFHGLAMKEVLWAIAILGGMKILREVRREDFVVNSIIAEPPLWEEIITTVVWVIGGGMLLPAPLLPTIPVISGMITTNKVVGRFVTPVLLSFVLLGIVGFRYDALTIAAGWPSRHLLAWWGYIALWISWVLAWVLTQFRNSSQNIRKQWRWVFMSWFVAWLFPWLIGSNLFGEITISLYFILSGLMSLGVMILGGKYATWSFIADVDEEG